MRIHEVLSRTFRHAARGVNAAGDVDVTVAANVNESGTTRTRVKSTKRVVQRSGKTVVSEERRERQDEKED